MTKDSPCAPGCDPASGDRPARIAAAQLASGCTENRASFTRRGVLGLTASLFSSALLPRWAEAADAASPRMLLVVIRGGMDGLSTVVPHGDNDYARLRGPIAIAASDTIRLDADFGLHPALSNFGSWYRSGDAAIVHATCPPVRNRSHFDAQDSVESGLPTKTSNPTGWLNRLLSELPSTAPVRRAGAIQIGQAPLVLRGPAPVLGWSPTWFSEADTQLRNAVLRVYHAEDREMEAVLRRGLEADDLADKSGGGSDDGATQIQRAFRGAARLMRASGGPHIAVLDIEGFDTHVSQGGITGDLADRLRELDIGLADFKRELGSLWTSTVAVCATEFGRTCAVNGGRGTDHGLGTVTLLAGGAVAGGKIHGRWPGLTTSALVDGDLRPTTDLRSVFKGVLQAHFDVPASLLSRKIFPSSGIASAMTGLIKTATASTSRAAGETTGLDQTPPPAMLRPRSAIGEFRSRHG